MTEEHQLPSGQIMSDQHTLEKRATASFSLVLFMMMLLGVVVGILMLLSLFIDPEVPFESGAGPGDILGINDDLTYELNRQAPDSFFTDGLTTVSHPRCIAHYDEEFNSKKYEGQDWHALVIESTGAAVVTVCTPILKEK